MSVDLWKLGTEALDNPTYVAELQEILGVPLEFRRGDTHIQWRRAGAPDDWHDLIAVEDLRGEPGEAGTGVEMDRTETHIRWRPIGGDWAELISIEDITGPSGADGSDGEPGSPGIPGADGSDGSDGASAYEIAVANGFIGTEADWLDSLIGPEGPKGDTGDTGPKGDTGDTGPAGADGDQGPAGDTGPKGDQGDQGPQGDPGITKRMELYTGTTNASGIYSVTFPVPFPSTPHLSVGLVNPNTETYFRITALSATGFTVHVFARSGLTVLAVTLLALATTNVSGASVRAMAIET